MNIKTITSRELNQDVARAKRATKSGPVFITIMCCSASRTIGDWLESAAISRTHCPWPDSERSI